MTTSATSAARNPADPMISVIGLYKSFGEKEVLRGVDLEIGRGESLMLVGGSGAGKSVFIKHLIGLLQPDEGHVVVDGVDLTHASPEAVLELRKRLTSPSRSAATPKSPRRMLRSGSAIASSWCGCPASKTRCHRSFRAA
ncbi:MAG: ATP-binding cassette domain-containing protein [Acidobacteria bacterium]|nr:ATP-binding cassette domain-containing protein [Candidatus Sulfomarinibacter kjeldsenii]